MDTKKTNSTFLDLLLFILLIILLFKSYKGAYSFLLMHRKSLIHELDRSFADQLYTTERQIRLTKGILDHINSSVEYTKNLEKLTDKLQLIEEKYTKNSPGLLFLGPLGTASIVLKEQNLSEDLLKIIESLGELLHSISQSEKPFLAPQTIDTGLQNNQSYITNLLKLH